MKCLDGAADFCLMMKYFVIEWEEIKRDKVSVRFYVLLKGLVVHNVDLCREQRSNVGSLKTNSSPSVATIAGTGTVAATVASFATVGATVATDATVAAEARLDYIQSNLFNPSSIKSKTARFHSVLDI